MTRTWSLYFLRSICAKKPRTPTNVPLPRRTISRTASGRSRQATSSGTPSSGACLRNSVNQGLYLGRFQGSVAALLGGLPVCVAATVGGDPFVGKDQVRGEAHGVPKPRAGGTRAEGFLKAKKA